MRILVTGGCGFIGSNFILQTIKNTSNNVINIDKLTYAGNKSNLNKLNNNTNYSFIKGDICDFKLISNTINQFKPDAIIHFAAESHVDRSIENPLSFVTTNIMGTTIMLQASLTFWQKENYYRHYFRNYSQWENKRRKPK